MSLYEGLEAFLLSTPSDGKSEETTKKETVASSLKLLQSHIQLKKISNVQQNREPKKQSSFVPAFLPSQVAVAHKSTRPSSKAVVQDVTPLSFPALLEADSSIDEWHVEDEYNPLHPNIYEKLVEEREDDRVVQMTKIQQSLALNYSSSSSDDEETSTSKLEFNREKEKRSMGVAIAPPQQLMEEDSKTYEEASEASPSTSIQREQKPGGSGYSGLDFAARIMQRYGYKQGSGLGKDEQGMSTALQVEKTGFNLGKIVHERDIAKDDAVSDVQVPPQLPEPPIESLTEILKNPTKVVLLRNMVGAGEVDADLQPEVQEEMLKFGEVKRCVIHEQSNLADWEAVRIFVEFAKQEQAVKAVVALNGRFFGGRAVHASFYDPDKFANSELTD